MKTVLKAIIGVLAFGLTVGGGPAMAQGEDPLPYRIGAAVAHKNLTVFPLYSRSNIAPTGNYLTFEQATRQKLISVTELEGNTSDAEVNTVHVSNKGKKPIFIMGGEIILGGKQDRVIAQDTIIKPKDKGVPVAVFCVEQGRWNGQTAQFGSGGSIGHAKLRSQAVFEDSQDKVWGEVAKSNEKRKVAPGSGTYRASLTDASKASDIEGYVGAILPKIKADTQALGLAVAIDGRMRVVDAFANPMLFAQIRDKMIRSYALEAATSDGVGKPVPKVDGKAVDGFFKQIRKAPRSTRKVKSAGMGNTVYDFEDDDIDGDLKGVQSKDGDKPVHQFYYVE